SGNVYYHYLNENFNSQGYGRVDRQVLAVADATGAIGYYYEYYTNSSIAKKKIAYASANYADPKNPVMGTRVTTYEYDQAGNLTVKYTYYNDGQNLLESKTMTAADAGGNVYYHYMNEGFYNNGTPTDLTDDYGRVDKQVRSQADADGAIGYYYEYYTGSAVIKKKLGYASANYADPKNAVLSSLLITYEFDASGNLTAKYTYYQNTGLLESATFQAADGSGNVYYHYLNENWNSTGLGRVDKQVLAAPDGDGSSGYAYEYYTGTSNIKVKRGYSVANYTDPKNPVFSSLLVTYTNWSDGRVYQKAIAGGETYKYYDENFNGTGIGRMRSKLEADGSRLWIYRAYWSGTNQDAVRDEYNAQGALVATYNYFYSGATVTGVRKIYGGRTTEFQGDFVRPTYDYDPAYHQELWWVYQKVWYQDGTTWKSTDENAAVIKHDTTTGQWYLYGLPDPANPWSPNWNKTYKSSGSQIPIYDAQNGNQITYPALPANLPPDMPWTEPVLGGASLMSSPENNTTNNAVDGNPDTEATIDLQEQILKQKTEQQGLTFTGQLATNLEPQLLTK
ncbi:MAG: hypothetical protein PHS37_09855, partial [Candidatus Omnitrophica bacterium]|nr:hypothetical protein [Candidatus Omnitrophota bacterium]